MRKNVIKVIVHIFVDVCDTMSIVYPKGIILKKLGTVVHVITKVRGGERQ